MLKHILLTTLLLAGPAAIAAEPTGTEASEERNNYARLQLAAAHVPGDLLSDAFIVEMMQVSMLTGVQDDTLDPVLREELVKARDRLAERVAAGMVDDPVLMATMGHCKGRYVGEGECDMHWARVAELAGDDGYLHFLVMSHAAAQGDEALFAHHAARAAQAETFESHLAAIFVPLYERYLQVPEALWPTDDQLGGPRYQAAMLAMASGAGFGLPAYQPVFRHCEAAQGEVRQLCVGVAKRLARDSSTLIDRMVGTAILRKLGSDQEKAWAREQRRQDQWLARVGWTLEERFDEARWDRYFEVYADRGEMGALRHANRVLGRSLEAPADWQPSPYGAEAD